MKCAFADVYAHVADPAHMRFRPEQLLDPGYLAERAKLIRPDRASDFGHGSPPRGGTIYLSAADERGMMVSFIQSNYMGFGSGIVVPGTGVSLQNRGYCFSLDAAHPNCVAPRKRPFQTIIPAFLTRDGQPQMSFGVMGGNMQPQGHLQTLVRMLDYGQNPQAACDAPRWKVNRGLEMDAEVDDARGGRRANCARWATRWSPSPTRTWTSARASSSGGCPTGSRTATSPPATAAATATPPRSEPAAGAGPRGSLTRGKQTLRRAAARRHSAKKCAPYAPVPTSRRDLPGSPMTYAAITGWGKCMPPAVLSNDDLSTFLDTNDEWIISRTGMKERRISHVPAIDLAAVARRAARWPAPASTPQDST